VLNELMSWYDEFYYASFELLFNNKMTNRMNHGGKIRISTLKILKNIQTIFSCCLDL